MTANEAIVPVRDSEREPDPRQWLSGSALELYEHLEATGQIARLKQMPQLGAVAWVRPEVKHTRWDYLALLLRLSACVARLDGPHQEIGEIELQGHRVGAPSDLLQCWAMLQNLGHLWGTYATERLVLNALAIPGRAQDLFIEGMTTEVDRAFARYVLDNYLLFKVNWALANGFLHMLPEHREAANRERWLAMLRAYRTFRQWGAAVSRLYFAQRRLRKLAFVHLDLAHANLPLITDMAAVERDPARYLNGFLWQDHDPLDALIEYVQRYIPGEIYYASDVVLVHRLLERRAGDRVRRHLNAARSGHDLFARLAAMQGQEAWPVVPEVVRAFSQGDYVHIHRIIETRPEDSVTKDEWNAQIRRIQTHCERGVSADSLVHANVPGDRSERWTDFYVRRRIGAADLARTLTVICQQIARPPAARDAPSAREACEGGEVARLVARLLALMLRDTKRVRLERQPEFQADASFLLVDGPDGTYARRRIERALRACACPARRHELQVLAASLEGRPADGFRIVMLCGFQVERRAEDSPGDAEFDGAYLDVLGEGAMLHIVEAKSTLDSPAALRQLRRRLRRLGWLNGARLVPIPGGAEASVPVRLRGGA